MWCKHKLDGNFCGHTFTAWLELNTFKCVKRWCNQSSWTEIALEKTRGAQYTTEKEYKINAKTAVQTEKRLSWCLSVDLHKNELMT